MRFRTYAWSSLIFLGMIEIVEFYAVLVPRPAPDWMFYPTIPLLIFGFLVPIIPLFIVKKVLKRYRISFSEIIFYSKKGKAGKVQRYAPALLAYVVFWLSFYLTTQI